MDELGQRLDINLFAWESFFLSQDAPARSDALACRNDPVCVTGGEARGQSPCASIRLLGRMSVQFVSMYSRQLARESVSCTTVQPSGTG
jgi:hypothetical protein